MEAKSIVAAIAAIVGESFSHQRGYTFDTSVAETVERLTADDIRTDVTACIRIDVTGAVHPRDARHDGRLHVAHIST